jgi:multicomponent Na+:H+ antiporter subunit B
LKALNYILLLGFAALLIYASQSLPVRGDLNAPMHRQESVVGTPVAGTHYIQNAFADAATPNLVTVVLADYRGFDTLGETIVVFSAGIACFLILRKAT